MDFEKLYNNYSADVYRYSLFNLKNSDDALDIVSETFTRLMESKDLSKVKNIKAWIIRIARNIIYSKYRQESKQVDLPEETKMIIENQPDNSDNADLLITEELIEQIKNELDKIDDNTREVIILKLWEDMKFNEISELLSEKESTIKLRYYRGLEKIKVGMQQRDRRKYVIAFPILCMLINEVSKSPEFSFGSDAAAHIWSELSNLNINFINMETSNAVSKVGFVQTSAFKIIAGLVLTGVITSVVILTAVKLNTPKDQNLPSPTPTVSTTPQQTPTVDPTEIPEGLVEIKTEVTEQLSERTYIISFMAPKEYKKVMSDGSSFDKFQISGRRFDLTVSLPYEAFPVHYDSSEIAYTDDSFGDVYVAHLETSTNDREFYFTNEFSSTPCQSTDTLIPAPCGSGALTDDNNNSFYVFRLFAATDEGIEEATTMMKTLSVVEAE